MRYQSLWSVLALLAILALAGGMACETRDMDEPIDPLEEFLGQTVQNGDGGVPTDQTIQVYVGKALDPGTVNSAKVRLFNASGMTWVPGIVAAMGGQRECSKFNTSLNDFLCPLGLALTAGVGGACDLDPNSNYVLSLAGVELEDGTPLPGATINFSTGDGSIANLCSDIPESNFIITGDTLDMASGLAGDLPGDTGVDLDMVAIGIDTQGGGTYKGYDWLGYERYMVALRIQNLTGNSVDLSGFTNRWINLRVQGKDHKIMLPAYNHNGGIGDGEDMVLYVANDGTTYYALRDIMSYVGGDILDYAHDVEGWGWNCDNGNTIGFYDFYDSGGSEGCPIYPPTSVFGSSMLAAPADGSSSKVPFILESDSIDPNYGLNGGILNEIPPLFYLGVLIFRDDPEWRDPFNGPYYGYAAPLDSSFKIGQVENLGGSTIIFNKESTILPKSQYAVGHYEFYQHGPFYMPIYNTAVAEFSDSILLLYIHNKDINPFSAEGRTITVRDWNIGMAGSLDVTVFLPGDTIDPGYSLPLYVGSSGSTWYAYDNVGDHTLDIKADGCDVGGGGCTVMDPATALTNTKAAP